MNVPFTVEPRRLAIVAVPVEHIAVLMCKTANPSEWFHVSEGIPKDAVMIDVRYCNESRQVWLTFEHETFKLTSPGNVVVAANDIYLTSIRGVVCDPQNGKFTVVETFPGSVTVIPWLEANHVVTG